ncbi:carbohydrate ABC transporter permease [Kaistia terrae]|nr:carbohydrate ABC transporter permease [Kaistia terrae]
MRQRWATRCSFWLAPFARRSSICSDVRGSRSDGYIIHARSAAGFGRFIQRHVGTDRHLCGARHRAVPDALSADLGAVRLAEDQVRADQQCLGPADKPGPRQLYPGLADGRDGNAHRQQRHRHVAVAGDPDPGGDALQLRAGAAQIPRPQHCHRPRRRLDAGAAAGVGNPALHGGARPRHINSTVGISFIYAASIMPLSIFIMRSFFMSLPFDLEDAARVDGAGRVAILVRIMLPLARPGMALIIIFGFIEVWNDFFLAFLLLRQPEVQTIPLGLVNFFQQYDSMWNLYFAALMITTLPVILLFVLMQRQFIAGLTAGAVKA